MTQFGIPQKAKCRQKESICRVNHQQLYVTPSEGEATRGGVLQFVKVRHAGECNHRRWTTHKDNGIGTRGRQVTLDHLVSDKA